MRHCTWQFICIAVVQSLSYVWLFVTPWTTTRQASLSLIISWSLLTENVSHSCDRDYFSPYSLTAGSKLTRYLGAHHVGRDLQGWYYSIVWCYSIWSPQLSKAQQGEGFALGLQLLKVRPDFFSLYHITPLFLGWHDPWAGCTKAIAPRQGSIP